MITDAFAEGKHFFLAKIVNKNMNKNDTGQNEGVEHSHFFNVYGILKLLFKKKED